MNGMIRVSATERKALAEAVDGGMRIDRRWKKFVIIEKKNIRQTVNQ